MGPGALVRYARQGQLRGPLARNLLFGSAPGVVIGAVLRVYVADDPTVFKLIAAAVLLPTGLFILLSTRRAGSRLVRAPLRPRTIGLAAFVVGIVGGIYGIGGGSILGPILVGSGMAVSVVAPAALASTVVTSIVGVATFAVLQVNVSGSIAPDWSLGVARGLGGLCGGYLGASLQPRLPEELLRACRRAESDRSDLRPSGTPQFVANGTAAKSPQSAQGMSSESDPNNPRLPSSGPCIGGVEGARTPDLL